MSHKFGVSDIVTNPRNSRDSFQEEDSDREIVPWTAEQVRVWRESNPSVSPWTVVGVQFVVGVLAALLTWLWSGELELALSVAYGALCVVLPAALFVRGLTGGASKLGPAAMAIALLVWEMVKLALTLVLLMAAPWVVSALSWPALLLGLGMTLSVYWAALLVRPRN